MANIKDGYALQLAVRKGMHIAIISGASVNIKHNTLYQGKVIRDFAHRISYIATYIVRLESGGCGVARDLLEEILRAKGEWPVTDRACGW